MASIRTFLVDDSDPSLTYEGTWVVDTDNEAYYNSTSHTAEVTGLSVHYTFNGTSIQLYGSVDTSGILPRYYLDNSTSQPFTLISSAVSPLIESQDSLLLHTTFNDGQHTLDIRTQSNTKFVLDYLAITTPSLAGEETSSTDMVSPVSTTGAQLSGRDHHHHLSNKVAVVVFALAACVVIIAIIVAVIIYRFKRRPPKPLDNEGPFDILPDDLQAQKSGVLYLLRFKKPGRTRGTPRTQTTRSSTLFTSVIFAPPSSNPSRR